MGSQPRMTVQRWFEVGAFVAAIGALSISLWVKLHTVDDPAWLGIGLVGVCLLLVAVGTHAMQRR